MPRKPTRTTTRTDPRDPRSKRKPDAAEKVARLTYVEGTITDSVLRFHLARRIRSAIRRAVEAERKRCIQHTDALRREYLTAYQTQPARQSLNIDVARDIERLVKKIRKGTP